METVMVKLPDTMSVALMVLGGAYGNYPERKTNLEKAGYNYNKVQQCVNELYNLMEKYK